MKYKCQILLVLALSLRCSLASVPADCIFNPDAAGSRGLATLNGLNNGWQGVQYVHYYGTNGPVDASGFQRTFIVAAQATNTLSVPISYGGNTYTGTTSNWVQFLEDTNLGIEGMQVFNDTLQTYASNTIVGGFVMITITNNIDPENVFSTDMVIDSGDSKFATVSLHFYGGSQNWLSHAEACDSSSTRGSEFGYDPTKVYFYMWFKDAVDGTNYVKFYDAQTWTQVGTSQCSICPGGNTYQFLFWIGYLINQMHGSYYLGFQYMKKGATFADFNAFDTNRPALPQGVGFLPQLMFQ